jgi:ribosomal protein L11 methyltransferase
MTTRYPYVHVRVSCDDVDVASDVLWSLGVEGVEEREIEGGDGPTDRMLIAYFPNDDEAGRAARLLGERWPTEVEHLEGDAWRDAWRAYFKPTRIGARLVIRPSWEPWDAAANDVVITIDPGAAFGTGTHESTRLLLGALDRHVRGGEMMLDYGAGSGVLAIAALRLGAKTALAIDVDPLAAPVAIENAERNAVSERLIACTATLDAITERYDLVTANIELRVLQPTMPAMYHAVQPGGLLMLSGLLQGQDVDIMAAISRLVAGETPLRLVEMLAEGEWIALVLEKDPGRAHG